MDNLARVVLVQPERAPDHYDVMLGDIEVVQTQYEFVAKEIARKINLALSKVSVPRETAEKMAEALKEITKGAGPFSLDPLTHAENTIEAMKETAREALSAYAQDGEGV